MISAVIDTNVVVSSVLNGNGAPARVLDLAINKKVRLYVSPAILHEYSEVLARDKFKLPRPEVQSVLGLIKATSITVKPTHRVTASPDEADNRFLECAEAAKADYLVTGNKRHFPTRWKTTTVVNPREFLEQAALDLRR